MLYCMQIMHTILKTCDIHLHVLNTSPKGFFCFSCIGITLVVNVHFTTICKKKKKD